jgi:hypothetical protein
VLAVIAGFRASTVDGQGSGDTTKAIRGDNKRGEEIRQDAGFLYAEDAPLAYQIAEAQIRSEEAAKAAADQSGITADLLKAEAAAQGGVAALLVNGRLVNTPAQAVELDGAALMARMAELRARTPELTAIDVEGLVADAQDARKESSLLTAALIPFGFALLMGACAQAFIHRRRLLVAVGWGFAVAGAASAIAISVAM